MDLLQGHLAFLLYFINMVDYSAFNVKSTFAIGIKQISHDVLSFIHVCVCMCVSADSIC